MVQAAITAERIIVSFDFFLLMAPASKDGRIIMDVLAQWMQSPSKVTGIAHCNE